MPGLSPVTDASVDADPPTLPLSISVEFTSYSGKFQLGSAWNLSDIIKWVQSEPEIEHQVRQLGPLGSILPAYELFPQEAQLTAVEALPKSNDVTLKELYDKTGASAIHLSLILQATPSNEKDIHHDNESSFQESKAPLTAELKAAESVIEELNEELGLAREEINSLNSQIKENEQKFACLELREFMKWSCHALVRLCDRRPATWFTTFLKSVTGTENVRDAILMANGMEGDAKYETRSVLANNIAGHLNGEYGGRGLQLNEDEVKLALGWAPLATRWKGLGNDVAHPVMERDRWRPLVESFSCTLTPPADATARKLVDICLLESQMTYWS